MTFFSKGAGCFIATKRMKGKDEIMEDTGNGKMIVITGGKVKDANVLVANHLHHKEKRRLFKTLAYILRIPIC